MMHEELWMRLIELEPQATAQRAKCEYLDDSGFYKIVFLGGDFSVDLNNKQILRTGAGDKDNAVGFLEQLCILAYLISARELPLADKLLRLVYLVQYIEIYKETLQEMPILLRLGKLQEIYL